MNPPETDSLDNSAAVPPLLSESVAPVVSSPRPIKIVRDGILAVLCSSAVTLIAAVVVLAGAMIAGIMSATPGATPTPGPGLVIALLLLTEIPFAGTAAILRWRYRSTGRPLLRLFEDTRFSSILLGIGAGLLLMVLGIIQASLVQRIFHRSANPAVEELMQTLVSARGNPVVAITFVLLVAVLTPFCEEYLFRGAIFSSVRSTDKARAGAVISSILFATAHLSPLMFTYYLIFGFTMCWLFSRTRTMAATIAAHITVNSIACAAMLLAPKA